MKNRLLSKLTIIIMITMIVLNYGCQEEDVPNEEILNKAIFNAPSIETAQQFFNQNAKPTTNKNARIVPTSLTDWESSTTKKYKQTQDMDVDILYTPIYLNTPFNAKAFLASTQQDGIVDSKKLYLLYKDEPLDNGLSAYIFIYGLDGVLQHIYNYQNGLQIPLADYNTNVSSKTGDCNANPADMNDEEFEEFLSNCYSALEEVTVTATIDADDSPSGGLDFSPWVQIDGLGYNDTTGGTSPNGGNPQVFTPNVVGANPAAIAIALEIPFSSIEFNWLQQQNYKQPKFIRCHSCVFKQ